MVNKTKKKGDLDFEEKASIPVKKRTTPTNTSLLPPCKVCLEPAAGFHYGVNTCEACKVWFVLFMVCGLYCLWFVLFVVCTVYDSYF